MTDDERRKLIRDWWWRNLGNRDDPAARARAARLRRANAVELLAERPVHDLAQALHLGPDQAQALVRVVQALAEVREGGPGLARALGRGDPPALSRLRFEKLIRSTPDEIGTAVRRALPMVGRACEPGRLGLDLMRWDETTRIRWAFDYFGAPAPDTAETDTAEETEA